MAIEDETEVINRFKERMEEVLSRFGGIDLKPADLRAILEAAIKSFTKEELETLLVAINRWGDE